MWSRIQPTYKEMIDADKVEFPSTVDDPTKALIYDFFKYREVCDEEQFPTFFFRTLSVSMRKYNEMLAIEPGQPYGQDGKVVKYDWLIQNYREHITKTQSNGSTTRIVNGSSSGESSNTLTDRSTVTMYGADQENTGVIKLETILDNETESGNRNASTTEVSQSSSDTDYESHTDSDTDTTGSTTNESSSNSKSLAKADPQSVSYAAATSGMPTALDWSYPGSQAEGADTSSDSGTSSSSSDTNTDTSGSTDTDISASRQSGSMESNDRTKAGSREDNGTEETNRMFGTQRTTENGGNKTEESSNSSETETTEDGSSTSAGTTTEQEQGRGVDIATLLSGAKSFILGSSAWDYLYGQIDKCFQGVIMEW